MHPSPLSRPNPSPLPSPRVLLVRNRLPEHGAYGGDSVLLEVSHYLSTHGCIVEFAALGGTHGFRPWLNLAPELATVRSVRVPGSFQCGHRLVQTSLPAWARYAIGALAGRLPAGLRWLSARLQHAVAHRSRRFDKEFSSPPEARDIAYVAGLARAFRPDALIVDYAWLTPLFAGLGEMAHVKKIVLGHESLHIRADRFKSKGLKPDLLDWDLATEVQHLAGTDILLLETKEEADIMRPALPGIEVICTPRGMKFTERTGPRVRGRCLFVGSDAPANAIGLRWFLESVWPLVLELSTEANLEVCGSVCDQFRDVSLPRVAFSGRVPSLEPHYGDASVCVVPLIVGTGLKTKLVEALSYGCACVATPTGAAGAESVIGSAVIVESDPRHLAEAIVRVVADDVVREAMELAAAAYAREHLTPDATFKPLMNLFKN